ncbi:2-hydroxyacid dehydrogenase [Robiginitalea sediminis]|uniref:2-hydroxyacid dehydrogenase n=1 Tax=Robiginitalea sediminis TaxID=1982593 RepID=UPI000B4BDA9F|nr:glyoxylate/hydroxypyruvate reductase A [Robiginitalea sediminis]
MAIAVLRNDDKTNAWRSLLRSKAPDIPVYDYKDSFPKEEIRMAAVWKHPAGSLSAFPNLLGIQGLGAGVDFILEDPDADPGIPVMRVVDPYLASDMAEYVLAQIMAYLRGLYVHASDKGQKKWNPAPYRRIEDLRVGIMGMGQLGTAVAGLLGRTGFRVQGWARTPKNASVEVYHGPKGLPDFLQQSDVLVCLLPLTPETQGILSASLLEGLPQGAFLINVARGPLLVDQDLIDALDTGRLSAACLDVFHQEPLPREHLFWEHPNVWITPHVASVTDPDSVADQVIRNYRALIEGRPPENLIDRRKGY